MRHFFLKRSLAVALGLAGVACTHNVDPNVTPAKIATVQPPIRARVLLIVAPAFETYTTESQNGIHHYIVHLGESASTALQDLVGASFQHLEVQHVSDAGLLQWLAAPGDTTRADLLLVPGFAPSSAVTRFVDFAADVRLRLDVRCYRTGATYSWTAAGHATRVIPGAWGGMTGSALERAIGVLVDTLSANRANLEAIAAR